VFVYSGGVYTAVDTSAIGTSVSPAGINDSGQIVGTYTDANGVLHGFVDTGGSFSTIDEPSAVSQSNFVTGIHCCPKQDRVVMSAVEIVGFGS
jgi:probable HAF family extracellular repeat protein